MIYASQNGGTSISPLTCMLNQLIWNNFLCFEIGCLRALENDLNVSSFVKIVIVILMLLERLLDEIVESI